MRTKLSVYVFLFLLVSHCVVGCGGGKVGLRGKVTFSDDDSPLTVGTVCFETDTFIARGVLQGDGSYSMGSMSNSDGLPPGIYRVYVTGAVRAPDNAGGGMTMPIPLIDSKFASGRSSGITAEITTSTKTFDFQVDRAR